MFVEAVVGVLMMAVVLAASVYRKVIVIPACIAKSSIAGVLSKVDSGTFRVTL